MSNAGPYGTYQADMGDQPDNPPLGIGYIIIVAGSPTTLGTTSFPGAFAFDSDTLTLYWTEDGTTWQEVTSGGAPTNPQVFSGTGDPNGVVSATAPALYYATDTGIIYQKTGSGNTGWN